MRLKYLFALLSVCWLVLFGQTVFAAPCSYTSSNLYPSPGTAVGAELKNQNGVWTASYNSTVTHTNLIDCRNMISGLGATRKSIYQAGLGNSNINITQSIPYGGKTYYKITGTGNPYVDTYGYIFFQVQATNGLSNPVENLGPGEIVLDGFIPGTLTRAQQGLNISNFAFYFTAGPTAEGSAIINIGTLSLSFPNYPNVSDQQSAYVTFDYYPENEQTCLVHGATVTLPTLSTSALTTAGSEAGRTNFSITTSCNAAENMTLYYTMTDNNDSGNNTDILTNTNTATPNVGIKVYDTDINTAVQYGTEYTFGVLGSARTSGVTKKFYATYYRKDNDPVSAGLVNAQATISVVYK